MSELNARRYSALRDLLQVLNDYFGAEVISAEFPPDLSACIANYVQVHEKGEHYHESRKILAIPDLLVAGDPKNGLDFITEPG